MTEWTKVPRIPKEGFSSTRKAFALVQVLMGSEVLLESPIAPNFSRTEATFLFSTVIGGAWGHFSPRSKTEHLRAWNHYFSAHEKPLAAVDHFFSAQTVSESFFVSDLLRRRCTRACALCAAPKQQGATAEHMRCEQEWPLCFP